MNRNKYTFLLLAVSLLLIIAPSLSSAENIDEGGWPMFGKNPQRTSFKDMNAPMNESPIWSFEAGDVIASQPVVSNGRVYVTSHDGNLYALDVDNGDELWSSSIGDWGGFVIPLKGMGHALMSSPAVENGTVYVGSLDGNFYAFDAVSGENQWVFEAGEPEAEGSDNFYTNLACLDGFYLVQIIFVFLAAGLIGFLYFSSIEFISLKGSLLLVLTIILVSLAVVPLFTDENCSSYRINGQSGSKIDSSPLVAEGKVFFGSRDNNLYALNAENGKEAWSFETGGSVTSSPAYYNGNIFFGSRDGTFYSLDADTGDLEWIYETSGTIHSSPAIEDEFVYFGNREGGVFALNHSSGEKIWRENIAPLREINFIHTSPALDENRVYIGASDRNFYSLNAETGEILWNYRTEYRVGYSSPAIADGIMYGGGYDGNYYAIDSETGEKIWSFEVLGRAMQNGYILSSPSLSDNKIFAVSSPFEKEGSQVYALGSPIEVSIENVDIEGNYDVEEEVPVSLDLKNSTYKEGDYVLRFKIRPESFSDLPFVKTKSVNLKPGENKTVKMNISLDRAGEYSISSPDYSGKYFFEITSSEERTIPEGYDNVYESNLGPVFYTEDVGRDFVKKGVDNFAYFAENSELFEEEARIDHLIVQVVQAGYMIKEDGVLTTRIEVKHPDKEMVSVYARAFYTFLKPKGEEIYGDKFEVKLIDGDGDVFAEFQSKSE